MSANLLTLNSEDWISHCWSQKATTYRQLLTQLHSFGIVFFLTNILQTDLTLTLCGVIEHSFIVAVSFWNFTTVVLVQNVKNLGGALFFITYFIFLDHPNVRVIFGIGLRDINAITSKPTWKPKHANSILEPSEYFYQISSKSIHTISSYTVAKLSRFFETQCTVWVKKKYPP